MIKLYRVGGQIRDTLLGQKSKDFDFSVEAESYDAMRQYILDSGGKIYLETPQYFTIRGQMRIDGEIVDADFVLCRKDGEYKDNRRPEDVTIGTIFDDLARRDFTMNAIAWDVLAKSYLDPHGGMFDISQKIIRCVGRTEDRFSEDALRMIRAIRFAITKDFSLHDDIKGALGDIKLLSLLKNISTDRIKDELLKCFYYNTELTLKYLEHFPNLRVTIFYYHPRLWFKPTLEE